MDPGRQAMINQRKSPPRNSITSPRRDDRNRITKPPRRDHHKPAHANQRAAPTQSYLSEEQQSRRYVADEDKFVLKQSKKKADIRVREGRAKPIDILAFNLRYIDSDRDVMDDDDEDIEIDVPSPSAAIERLRLPNLLELETDIASYQTLETNQGNKEYWAALKTICADRIQKLKPLGPEERTISTVSADVDKILAPKNLDQLKKLEGQIQAKLRSDEVLDTDYWEQLLKSLLIYKARATLQAAYAVINENRIRLLQERNPTKAEQLISQNLDSATPANTAGAASSAGTSTSIFARPGNPASSSLSISRPTPSATPEGSGQPPPGTARFAATEDEDFSQATRALYEREVARGINENEEIFTEEETVVVHSKPKWASKYRPRKPRYFNRVQMGYEWNKYNQTHYDHDNPPPKVVHGYKFNIFYPDLIDKTKAPTFKITREHGRRRGESFAPTGQEDTCLIRFIAGPPYEDIAFRIVDREWDYSAKKERGFKNTFDKGILQLHFQFKKIYYRK